MPLRPARLGSVSFCVRRTPFPAIPAPRLRPAKRRVQTSAGQQAPLQDTESPRLPRFASSHSRHIFVATGKPFWPSKVELSSPFMTELMLALRKHSSELPVKVACADIPSAETWSSETGREAYDLHVFPDSVILKGVTTEHLPQVLSYLSKRDSPSPSAASDGPVRVEDLPPATRVFVCTHGERDCRCGETGEAVYDALRKEAESRQDLEVRRTSHVGGHEWAGNVIIYPPGDWFGLVTPSTLPSTILPLLPPDSAPKSSLAAPLDFPWTQWRGRVGLSADKMERSRNKGMGSWERNLYQAPPTPAMVKPSVGLTVTDIIRGDVSTSGYPGERLLDAAKRAGVDLEGACGGEMECATCHVLVDPASAPGLSPPTEDEMDTLDAYAPGDKLQDTSRLACQIRLEQKLDGLKVEVPR